MKCTIKVYEVAMFLHLRGWKCGGSVRSGYAFVTTAGGEAGKPCEVGWKDVHLAQKCGECVRGGSASVTIACEEAGKPCEVGQR